MSTNAIENKPYPTTELLSPAGNFACAISAFTYGADAIYLGLKNFSARADAMNFTDSELISITSIAHARGKKVYVAINTLIQNSEIPELLQKLTTCTNANVDGIILQDFSLIPLIKQYFPSLPMHASTQMAVHNLDGAQQLRDMGFSRVVLARELSFPEIENITRNCGIEVEVFIHGALCYSYSGLCMYSSLACGESANRGKCTYPCRKLYSGTHPYAMKDLSLGEYVTKLASIGVASLKIEGRKKTPLYVASTADYYRRILDGRDTTGCLENIKRIFARPYTTLHFNGKNKNVIDRDFSGPRGLAIGSIERVLRPTKFSPSGSIVFRTSFALEKHDGIAIEIPDIERPFGFAIDKIFVSKKLSFTASPGDVVEIPLPSLSSQSLSQAKARASGGIPQSSITQVDIPVGARVYCTSSQSVKQAYPISEYDFLKSTPQQPIDITVTITRDMLTATALGVTTTLSGPFDATTNPSRMQEGATTAFSKLGDTGFVLNKFTYNNSGFFVPISELNEVRRNLLSAIADSKSASALTPPTIDMDSLFPVSKDLPYTGHVIKVDNLDYLSSFTAADFADIAEVLVDLDADFSSIPQLLSLEKIRISIPTVLRQRELPVAIKKIQSLVSFGIKRFSVSNIGAIHILKSLNITNWIADYHLYALNNFSISTLLSLGAGRITLSPEDSKANIASILSYFGQRVDLLVYGDVPLFISDNCTGDCKNCHSTDTVIIRHCRHFILNEKPFYIGDSLDSLVPQNIRADFCYKKYTPAEVLSLWHQILGKKSIKHTSLGNFVRGFL